MTPHYSWTPASEPPDTARKVLVWRGSEWGSVIWTGDHWFMCGRETPFTHWRDVEPPDMEAPNDQ